MTINNKKIFWPNNSIYFLTGSTFLHYPYFKSDSQKQTLFNQFKKIKNNYYIPISAYSISINHYHIKLYLKNGTDLAKVKQLIHGGTTYNYKKRYQLKYNNIWHSSRAYIITSDEMNWKVSGYIAGNLLKHKEVNTFEELKNNRFSSFGYLSNKHGEAFVRDLVYSVINAGEDKVGEINIEELNSAVGLKPSASAQG